MPAWEASVVGGNQFHYESLEFQRRTRGGRLEERWLDRYQQLLVFQAYTARLPRESSRDEEHFPDEARVASWMRYQRRRAERGIMAPWQQVLLEQIPGYSWGPSNDQWERQYGQLREFLEAEGHLPRYRSTDMRERELGAWVSKQRYLHRRWRLSAERVEALRQLQFRIV